MARNEGYDSNEARFLVLTIVFTALGILVMLSSFLKMPLAEQRDIIALGVGLIAIGVGFLGAWIAIKSDNKMKAIANLEFDEKSAMMQEYRAYFSDSFDEAKFERFKCDLEAMAHVARWADEDKRVRISCCIDAVAGSVDKKVSEDSIKRIRFLSARIRR